MKCININYKSSEKLSLQFLFSSGANSSNETNRMDKTKGNCANFRLVTK